MPRHEFTLGELVRIDNPGSWANGHRGMIVNLGVEHFDGVQGHTVRVNGIGELGCRPEWLRPLTAEECTTAGVPFPAKPTALSASAERFAAGRPNLFCFGSFILSSGAASKFKIDCDALGDGDISCLAELIAEMVGPFASVEGVPTGGVRLANALTPKAMARLDTTPAPHLIVDDVLTTGRSIQELRVRREKEMTGDTRHAGIRGAVLFARGPCPSWVRALFQMPAHFWTTFKRGGKNV